jgi:hypothetical protein
MKARAAPRGAKCYIVLLCQIEPLGSEWTAVGPRLRIRKQTEVSPFMLIRTNQRIAKFIVEPVVGVQHAPVIR